MGKNQAYKSMQRSKMASPPGPGGVEEVEDGMMDGSFHSPEWHAARLASLQTSHTITWEEYRKRQKEEAKKKEEQEDDEVRLMKEYRAQLDAERGRKLARGTNHADKKLNSKGRKDKDKDKKRKRLERKRRHMGESESDSAISTDEDKCRSGKKERDRSKRGRKEGGHKSHSKLASDEKEHGPVPLSSFFEGSKS